MTHKPSSEAENSLSDWRFLLTIGLSVGIAIPISKGVEQAVLDSVGPWTAFGIKLAAAAAIGAILALVVNFVISWWWPITKPTNGDGSLNR